MLRLMSDTSATPESKPREKAGPRTAPIALWRVAEAFLQTLHMLFGAPEDVARQAALFGKAHGQLASWIRCAEAMLRALLLMEAAALPKPGARPPVRRARQRVRRAVAFWPDKPEDWAVSFRVLHLEHTRPPRPAPSLAGAPRKRLSADERWAIENLSGPQTVRDAWPLALRYEALIRVFNEPAPFAARLARRLHAAPHRRREVLRAPPEAAHRVERFEELRENADAAWREWRSSG